MRAPELTRAMQACLSALYEASHRRRQRCLVFRAGRASVMAGFTPVGSPDPGTWLRLVAAGLVAGEEGELYLTRKGLRVVERHVDCAQGGKALECSRARRVGRPDGDVGSIGRRDLTDLVSAGATHA